MSLQRFTGLPENFTAEGLLLPGDYEVTLAELRTSLLVVGPATDRSPNWDESHRLHLVDNLTSLVRILWLAKIENIYIDGSFVEDKDHPNDIDGYFECDAAVIQGGRLAAQLNAMSKGIKAVWTWDVDKFIPDPSTMKRHMPTWYSHSVELFAEYGQFSGITDIHGIPKKFPSAFRTRRSTYERKGIIKIVKAPAGGGGAADDSHRA